jgi:hypothetical protein
MTLSFLPLLFRAQARDLTMKNIFAIGDQTSFPIEFRQGMIFVPVRINGSRPLSFMLDTGSTQMLVDRALANGLGLKPTGQGSLQGAGAGRIPNVDLGCPGLKSRGYEFSTADLQSLEASIGVKVDDILAPESYGELLRGY